MFVFRAGDLWTAQKRYKNCVSSGRTAAYIFLCLGGHGFVNEQQAQTIRYGVVPGVNCCWWGSLSCQAIPRTSARKHLFEYVACF